jgi:hypothetical protein
VKSSGPAKNPHAAAQVSVHCTHKFFNLTNYITIT